MQRLNPYVAILALSFLCTLGFSAHAQQTDSKKNFPDNSGSYYEASGSYIKLASCASLIVNRESGGMSKEEQENVKAIVASPDQPSFVFVTPGLEKESLKLWRVSTLRFELQINFAAGTGTMKPAGTSITLAKLEPIEGKKDAYRVRVVGTLVPDQYFFMSEYERDSKPTIGVYGCFTVK